MVHLRERALGNCRKVGSLQDCESLANGTDRFCRTDSQIVGIDDEKVKGEVGFYFVCTSRDCDAAKEAVMIACSVVIHVYVC